MDYRDRNGYFQEDVLQVLGRSGILGSSGGSVASSIHGSIDQGHLHQQYAAPEPLIYQALKDGNFSDSDLTLSNVFSSSDSSSTTSNTTESSSSSASTDQLDMDAEWEEVKHILYTTFIGMLLPVAFRYVGRRVTLSIWTRFLTSYFK